MWPGKERDGIQRSEEEEETRKAALEFMVSLTEAKPAMARRMDGWVAVIVRACLEGMGELNEDQDELVQWLEADVSVFLRGLRMRF